jgi:hypothetical protein
MEFEQLYEQQQNYEAKIKTKHEKYKKYKTPTP